ncbi:MAG TPA: hypothetical protein VEB65_08240, partial [Solirubrobacterales bacterium]|nr:hypothetical protein [Solirubrobacterales bacterium]
RVRCLVVAGLLAAYGAAPASAAPWQRVTTPDGSSTDQVGLARSGDGALHVVWHHPTGPNTEDLNHTLITSAGRIGATNPIQSGWTGFTNAALVVEPGGLRAFWGGFRTTDPSDPQRETNTALSPDGGASWALQPGQVNPGGAQSYASSHAATVRGDGSTLQAFAGTLGTWVHAGLSPASPNYNFTAGQQYGNDPNLATDATNRTVMAWYSNATGRLGVLAQSVNADGSPGSGPLRMPGTGGMNVGMLGRTPLAARAGGGFYVAYPTPGGIRVWRVGAGEAPVVTGYDGSPAVAIAAAGDGRIWVLWTQGFGDPDVLARRSNKAATRFGAIVDAGHPRDALQAYKLDANVAGNELDVLANFNLGSTSNAATSYRRLQPGITLRARPGTLPAGQPTEVLFTVSDAGEPVAGATVRAAGSSGTTDGMGRVKLTLRARTTVAARASRSGYATATRSLALRRD